MADALPDAIAPSIEAVLARRGLLAGAALERVRRLEADTGERIDRIAAKLGMIADADLAAAYAELLDLSVLPASAFPAEPVAAETLRRPFLRHARVVPLALTDAALTVAMADPLDEAAVRALAFAVDRPVIRRVALPTDVEAAHERLYGATEATPASGQAQRDPGDEDRDADLERLKDLASEAPRLTRS
jgi:general secretion pathway protein E